MNSDLDFELRQVRIMRDLIYRFRRRELDINKFIVDQWAIIDLLEKIDSDWKETYRSLINQVEDIYSISIFQEMTEISMEDSKTIDQILFKLELMLAELEAAGKN